jgi:hypothetical protein
MEMKKTAWGLNSFVLHLLAMALMLADHLWAIGVPSDLLTWLGRLAFPLFAFMLVEGYFHTRNLKKYIRRLLITAVITELPFNLLCSGGLFYPLHQNVIWSFLISLLCIRLIERARRRGKLWLSVLVSAAVSLMGFLLGMITMVDYYGYGILITLVFYFLHGRKWYHFVGQAVLLWYITWEMMGGLVVPMEIGSWKFELSQQGMSVLALIPIWLYNGQQGPYNRWIRYFYYAFYPLHMLILGLVQLLF